MPRINEWTEERTGADGVVTTVKIKTIASDEQIAQEDAIDAAKREALVEANASALWEKSLPRTMILRPGEDGLIPLPDDSVLSIGVEGEVFKDGRRLGTGFAAALVGLGKSIYLVDADITTTVIKRWTGTTWSVVKEQLDPRVFDAVKRAVNEPPNVQ